MRVSVVAAAMMATALTSIYAFADDKPFEGVSIRIASENGPYSGPLMKTVEQVKEELGIDVTVEIMNYSDLLTKATADFVGDTQNYDIVLMDNVWAGQFAEAGYTVDLTELMTRDGEEIDIADIYPVVMTALGNYDGKQVAFPFQALANLLAYRPDLYEAAGLEPPKTMADLIAAAKALTDPDKRQYGWVANGQKGAAAAQDFMQYNSQFGGSIMGPDGKPALNSEANVQSLKYYKQLFDESAPPGAVEFDWSAREQAFREGIVANMQAWSVAAAGIFNPEMSKVADKAELIVAPVMEGMEPTYGVGGWGLSINADIEEKQKEAAWAYIKWATSPAVQKQFFDMGSGAFVRKSTATDPELVAKFPFFTMIDESFENGDGEFRPRIPQYPQIQDLLGDAVNAVLAGGADPQAALDAAQEQALTLF